jgi:hypothetical protein
MKLAKSIYLSKGCVLYDDIAQPMMTMIEDTVRRRSPPGRNIVELWRYDAKLSTFVSDPLCVSCHEGQYSRNGNGQPHAEHRENAYSGGERCDLSKFVA